MNPQIMIAPNGARRGKSDHPGLPITIAETVAVASSCCAAGADALHLHVRDTDGQHTLDVGRYREAITELDNCVPGLAVQVTTESAGRFDVAAQLKCLRQLQPAWASISVREVAREPDLIDRIYAACADQGTRVQHILYDKKDAAVLRDWQCRGRVPRAQSDVILVLGQYNPAVYARPDMVKTGRSDLSDDTDWMVCAFGPHEQECLLAAAAQGSALRVGFENNLCRPDGSLWADMAEAVRSLRASIKDMSNEPHFSAAL